MHSTHPPLPPVDADRLARNWRAIGIELDAPAPSRSERLLRRLGMPSHITRPMVATPALRRSWFVALGLVVLIGLTIADPARPRTSAFGLLALAPLLPVLGVATAYGSADDPAHEVHTATPTSGLRLLLLRTAAVLCVAVPIVTLTALLSPVTRPWAAAWLLPALAVSSLSLALMTWLSPRASGALVACGWMLANVVARGVTDDALAMFLPGAQVSAAVVAALSVGTLWVRRVELEQRVAA